MRHRLLACLTAAALVAPLLSAAPAAASDRFTDLDRTVHADAIEAIAQVGVAGGFPDGTYRPGLAVTRDQMATFLTRALQLTEWAHDFADVDEDDTHSGAIGAIAQHEVTRGCGAERYCPRDEVTRAQMATFLTRALDLPDDPGQSFDDVDDEDVHAPGIRAVAAAGITLGCGDGTRYCPASPVQRDQMAAFLDRALGLDGPVPCRDVSGTATPRAVGSAVFGFSVSTGVRTDDRLELASMDLEESRLARVPADDAAGEVTGTATVARGTRTWATAAGGSHLFVGQDVDGANLYRVPLADADDRPVTEVAEVPYGGEFWALALDEAADRLWAGTRGHRHEDLADDEHVVYRLEDVSHAPDAPEPVRFRHDELPRDGEQRPDVKQLHWEASTGTLFVGLGGSATFPGAARLYGLDLEEAELDTPSTGVLDGDRVEDLTPPEIADDELEIFSLAVTDTHLAVGTRSESRAQVAFRSRDGGDWTMDTLREGERRVDRLALTDGRLVAASFPSGTIWEYDLATGSRTELGSAPGAANQPTRHLEADATTIRGVTGQGLVWTRANGSWSSTPFSSRSGSGALTAPGLAHSLAVTNEHVVAGANNNLQIRRLDAPSRRRVVPIGGEAKALTTDGRAVWAASYPGAALWRIDPGNGEAEQVGTWDGRYQRPRDAAFSSYRNKVLVVARTDPAYASGLFQMGPRTSELTAVRVTDGAPWLESWQQRNVQATAVATHGDHAYVGTFGAGVKGESGGVVAYDLRTMRKVWYARPARGEVVSLEVVDGRIVGAAQPNSSGSGHTWFELDPDDGELLAAGSDHARLEHGPVGDAVSVGPATIGAMGRALTALQRGADRATTLTRHEAHETFGGPFVDLDRRDGRCDIYAIEQRRLLRLPYDPATRLDH